MAQSSEKQVTILINGNNICIDNNATVGWLVKKLGLLQKISSLKVNNIEIADPAQCKSFLKKGDVVEVIRGVSHSPDFRRIGIIKYSWFLFIKGIKLIKKISKWKYYKYFRIPFYYNDHKVFFDCRNLKVYTRALSLTSKEPETIRWIESFDSSDVLWDIGSNVGIYSIVAAINNVKVFSFEPAAYNYCIQINNINLNNLQNMVSPLLLAINDKDKIDSIYMSGGDSGNTFGSPTDVSGNKMNYIGMQSVIGVSLDTLTYKFKVKKPNHIKIDVDGIEYSILKGALNTLSIDCLKTISVEIDLLRSADRENIVNLLYQYNFVLWRINGDRVSSRYDLQNNNGICFNYLFINNKRSNCQNNY